MWQGYGAWGNDAFCGVDYGDEISYVPQRAYVLSADGKSIDEAQTLAMFGVLTKDSSKAPDTTRETLNYPGPDLPAGATPFRAIADSIGIFGYDGHYYIQTENMPRPRGARLPPVKVFLREHAHTTQVCAFRPQVIPTEF
jgi:hypothetical protein